MNEQRKSFQDYANPKQTKHQQSVDELIATATMLLTHHRKDLSMTEIIYIENLLHKQLNQRNARIPNNVLRGIERKLQNIKNQIER